MKITTEWTCFRCSIKQTVENQPIHICPIGWRRVKIQAMIVEPDPTIERKRYMSEYALEASKRKMYYVAEKPGGSVKTYYICENCYDPEEESFGIFKKKEFKNSICVKRS